ncbi:MAG: hypothetical protein HQ567_29085, partial [Candidatus Nealsonbacteria bacterium]|nr:hypothetical protein [Candidatus Nealsonbacteria bacterium]
MAGLPLQIRLAALEDPADHSLSGWVAFDDVTLDKSILNDYIWDADPANNGDWMLNPTNWEDDGPLTAADNAVIEQVGEGGTTGVLTVSTADAAASSLDVNHGTVDVTDTGLLTIAGDVTVVGGATLSVDGTLTAASINSSGTLSGSGTLTAATINSSGTLSGSGTINADPIDILGTIAPGGAGIGTLTLGSGEMGLDPLATFEAQVSLAVVGPIEADMSTTLVADQLVLDDEDTALQIGGTLAISSLGDRTDAGYWATSPVVIDNPLSGQIGDTGGLPYTGREFDAVTPAPPAPGEPALHLGQGLFLRPGAGVTYVRPGAAPTITEAVELDVLVALGGDADGDG